MNDYVAEALQKDPKGFDASQELHQLLAGRGMSPQDVLEQLDVAKEDNERSLRDSLQDHNGCLIRASNVALSIEASLDVLGGDVHNYVDCSKRMAGLAAALAGMLESQRGESTADGSKPAQGGREGRESLQPAASGVKAESASSRQGPARSSAPGGRPRHSRGASSGSLTAAALEQGGRKQGGRGPAQPERDDASCQHEKALKSFSADLGASLLSLQKRIALFSLEQKHLISLMHMSVFHSYLPFLEKDTFSPVLFGFELSLARSLIKRAMEASSAAGDGNFLISVVAPMLSSSSGQMDYRTIMRNSFAQYYLSLSTSLTKKVKESIPAGSNGHGLLRGGLGDVYGRDSRAARGSSPASGRSGPAASQGQDNIYFTLLNLFGLEGRVCADLTSSWERKLGRCEARTRESATLHSSVYAKELSDLLAASWAAVGCAQSSLALFVSQGQVSLQLSTWWRRYEERAFEILLGAFEKCLRGLLASPEVFEQAEECSSLILSALADFPSLCPGGASSPSAGRGGQAISSSARLEAAEKVLYVLLRQTEAFLSQLSAPPPEVAGVLTSGPTLFGQQSAVQREPQTYMMPHPPFAHFLPESASEAEVRAALSAPPAPSLPRSAAFLALEPLSKSLIDQINSGFLSAHGYWRDEAVNSRTHAKVNYYPQLPKMAWEAPVGSSLSSALPPPSETFYSLLSGASYQDFPEFWGAGIDLFSVKERVRTYFWKDPPACTLVTLVPEAAGAIQILRTHLHLLRSVVGCPTLTEVLHREKPAQEVIWAAECALQCVFRRLAGVVRSVVEEAKAVEAAFVSPTTFRKPSGSPTSSGPSGASEVPGAPDVGTVLLFAGKVSASVFYFLEVAIPAYYYGVRRLLSPLWSEGEEGRRLERLRVYALCSSVELAMGVKGSLLALLRASVSPCCPGFLGDVSAAAEPGDVPTARMVAFLKRLSELQAGLRSALPDLFCRSLFTDLVAWALEAERARGGEGEAEQPQAGDQGSSAPPLLPTALAFLRAFFSSERVSLLVEKAGSTAPEPEEPVLEGLRATAASLRGANIEVLTL